MKIKTVELIGGALDWAVAKCQGHIDNPDSWLYHALETETEHYYPSTSWSIAGPIIEREIGNLYKQNKIDPSDPDVWTAIAYIKAQDGTSLYYCDGSTPLIAAMRCYVMSTLGDEVDLPGESV